MNGAPCSPWISLKHCLSTNTMYTEFIENCRRVDYTISISYTARDLPKMTNYKRSLFCQNQFHLFQKLDAHLQYAPNMNKVLKNPLKTVEEVDFTNSIPLGASKLH